MPVFLSPNNPNPPMQHDSGDFSSLKSPIPAPDSVDRRCFKPSGLPTPAPEQENLRCPRCDSMNTKFCYYNNYNLSQPRHFCKSCRRYWTKGGALRNIPVGGGSRKNAKRSTTATKPQAVQPISVAAGGECESPAAVSGDGDRVFDGSFGSLLGSSGYFGALGEPFVHGWSLNLGFQKQGTVVSGSGGFEEMGFGRGFWPLQETGESGVGNSWQGNGGEGFEGDCWGGNGWPELAISAPGKSLQ